MPLTFAAIPALALLAQPTAHEGDGLYLELGGGLSSTTEMTGLAGDASFRAGYSLNALVGYEWREAVGALDFGLEAEGLFTRQTFDDFLLGAGSSDAEYLSMSSIFVNGVLSWPYSEELTFYGGVGAGFAPDINLESQENAISEFRVQEDAALVYNAKAGMRFNFGDGLEWFLQYRHVGTETLRIRDETLDLQFNYDLEQDLVETGLRWGL